MKKTIASVALLSWMILGVSPAFGAAAKPTIISAGEKTKSSFVITVRSTELKKKGVKIDVVVKTESGAAVKSFVASRTMKSNGRTTVDVTGLRAHTAYKIKVRIRKNSVKGWSAFSAFKKISTL